MKKTIIITIFLSFITNYASSKPSYPYVEGDILFELRSDNILRTDKSGTKDNAGYVNIEPNFALVLNENWSVATGWRILPVRQRQYQYPERQRTILGQDIGINRGFNNADNGLIVEELKLDFENEDMKFAAGKFNPNFGTLHRRNKRIGLFVTDITEDYELREMLGASISALLEDSEISISTFFRDTTGLSNSAINRRKSRNRNDGIAGNTGSLSSYVISMEGRDFLGVKNLFYNAGYRSLGADSSTIETGRETGFSGNLEYLYKVSRSTYLIPVAEYVKIHNFTGRKGRDGEYLTASLIGKYSGWSASVAAVFRNLDNNYPGAIKKNNRDQLYQFSVGYKFKNNIAIDISRAELKEDGHEASMLGAILSYLYEF